MRSNNGIHNKVVYSFASAEAILATGGFLRLEEEYWFRVVFVTTRGLFVSCCFFFIFFVLLTARAFSLEGVILFHTSFRHHSLCSRSTLS